MTTTWHRTGPATGCVNDSLMEPSGYPTLPAVDDDGEHEWLSGGDEWLSNDGVVGYSDNLEPRPISVEGDVLRIDPAGLQVGAPVVFRYLDVSVVAIRQDADTIDFYRVPD